MLVISVMMSQLLPSYVIGRYVNFIKSLSLSNNACVANCVKLIQKGSQSAVSNNKC